MDKMLYIVDYPRKSAYAEAAIIPVSYDYDRIERCPECGGAVSGAYWMQPRELVLTSRKVPDFLYAYCDNVPFLLSENAIDKICKARLTGIEAAEEIELVRFQRKSKSDNLPPKYYRIKLARSRITVDHEKSVIHYGRVPAGRKLCPLCHQVDYTMDFTRRICFNMDDYEGFDIFQTYELGNTVCLSQQFVDFCRENGLTNLHCTPAQKSGGEVARYFLDNVEEP